jgi:hypothetical protein
MRYLIGFLAVILALTGLVLGVSAWEAKIETRGYNRAMAEVERKATVENMVQRKIEQARITKQQEALNESRKREELARVDADRARAARGKLQADLDAIRNRPASSNPEVAAERETTRTLGDLFGLCSQRYTVLGLSADQAREAGKLCERYYDANVETPITDAVNKLKGPP